ncbi:hypothetical protein O6379_24195, partial [Salmonella enterica subsp. enterica]|nr:hypothetical protein [Salmonella enterica]
VAPLVPWLVSTISTGRAGVRGVVEEVIVGSRKKGEDRGRSPWPDSIESTDGDKLPHRENICSSGVKMSRRFDHLGDVETFVTVVEKGSM